MAQFDIEISDMQTIAFASLEEEQSALGDAIWAADNQRERLAGVLKRSLNEDAEELARRVRIQNLSLWFEFASMACLLSVWWL